MAYTKQNFVDQQVLTASHLNHIEDGIVANESNIAVVDGKLGARNLLDNSDFRNPINQRGQTSYTGNTYTIDRWNLWSPNGKLAAAVEDGCVRFWNGDTEGASFGQKFPTGTFDSEKSYTFAYMTTDGIVRIRNNPIERYEWGEAVNIGLNPNETKLMVWAALYEGEYTAETLPPYVPKGYSAELLECQRYYVQFPQYFTMAGYRSTSNYGFIFLPTEMRVAPTATFDTDNSSAYVVAGSNSSITAITSVTWKRNGIRLTFTTAGELTNYRPINANFKNLKLSADL